MIALSSPIREHCPAFLHCPLLSLTVLCCPLLSFTVRYCPLLSFDVLVSCAVLCCPALSSTALHCPALSCTVLHFPALLCTVRHWPELSCMCCWIPLLQKSIICENCDTLLELLLLDDKLERLWRYLSLFYQTHFSQETTPFKKFNILFDEKKPCLHCWEVCLM